MNRIVLTLATVAFMAITPTASALTLTGPAAANHSRFLEASQIPLPDMEVRLERADCPTIPRRSCYIRDWNTIYLSPSAGHEGYDLYHEIGHAFDRKLMSAENRAWFARQSWSTDPERFADIFASCAAWGLRTWDRNRTVNLGGYGGTHTRIIYRRMCRYLRYYTDGLS